MCPAGLSAENQRRRADRRRNTMKRLFALLPLLLCTGLAQALIIYRPENSSAINTVRCYIRITDESGNDVTAEETRASYAWITDPADRPPKDLHPYAGRYYLEGGIAAHIGFRKQGRYTITVYTPADEQQLSPAANGKEWVSNTFTYRTDSTLKVLFVSPTADDNGFYDGGWYLSHRAPKFYKVTKPHRH